MTQSLDKPVLDFMDNRIEKGVLIVYATTNGSSAKLTLGEVLDVKVNDSKTYNQYSIKVQPLQDSYGRRWSNTRYDYVERKMVEEGLPKPVTLKSIDKLMVIT